MYINIIEIEIHSRCEVGDFVETHLCKLCVYIPAAAVAYEVIPEPGIGQCREFESPRVHTRINPWGLFLAHKLTCGKRESVC